MNVSFAFKLFDEPFGGGNQFGKSLRQKLYQHQSDVVHDLDSKYLDIILLTGSRGRLTAYETNETAFYSLFRNRSALIVHRINECDERKNTKNVNKRLRRADKIADHTVFVSEWLRDLHLSQGMNPKSYSIILNGSDTNIFNPRDYKRWNGEEPLRIVTHHWGASWQKGFDIYQRLDNMLAKSEVKEKYHFTYIGNLPDGFTFKNSEYIPPLSGKELADALRRNHVYLTASRNEPGSNHQNEGALCGLPLLYIENASMPEYCAGYGIGFTPTNFDEKLELMYQTYHDWADKMVNYPHTSERTTAAYYDLFQSMIANRDEYLAKRRKIDFLQALIP